MLAESKTMNSPNHNNKIMISIRPDFLQTTNMRSKDPILIVYEDDQIVIKKQESKNTSIDDLLVYRERMKDYEKFYTLLEKDVIDFIGNGDRKGIIKIDNLVTEAKNELPGIEIDKKMLLNGMSIFFKKKGIKLVRTADMEGIVFKADNAKKDNEGGDR
jgi:hypothetical protein